MSDFLYKVSQPRSDLTFAPSRFWRTEDWKSSSSRSRDGYIEDEVLYTAEFDEINIHLLPKIWRLRAWLDDHNASRLARLGHTWGPDRRALIFCRQEDRAAVENFQPTIFTFPREGFEAVPSNEFISRAPRTALGSEPLTMPEAVARWCIDIHFVEDAATIRSMLDAEGIHYSVQT